MIFAISSWLRSHAARASLNHRLNAPKPPARPARPIPKGCQPLAGGCAPRHPRIPGETDPTPAGVAATSIEILRVIHPHHSLLPEDNHRAASKEGKWLTLWISMSRRPQVVGNEQVPGFGDHKHEDGTGKAGLESAWFSTIKLLMERCFDK